MKHIQYLYHMTCQSLTVYKDRGLIWGYSGWYRILIIIWMSSFFFGGGGGILCTVPLKNLLFQNIWANFNYTASLGERDFICTNEGLRLFPREDNNEMAIIHWQYLNYMYSPDTLDHFYTKFGTKVKHSLVKGI